jgi:hypothetical protein
MLAFFSGYPLVYYLLRFFSRKLPSKNIQGSFSVPMLPWTYALIGTFYLTLQLSNLYPDFTLDHIRQRIQQPLLLIWGLLSMLFWIPVFSKKYMWTVLHSLVFFFLIVKDLFFYVTGILMDRDIIKNDMRIYTISILLNLVTYTLIFLITWMFGFGKKIS